MRFLLPHVEPKMENSSSKRDEDSDPEEPEPQIRHRSMAVMPSLPDLSFPSQETKPYEDEDEDSQPSPKKVRLNSMEEEVFSSCQCNRSDPDELFLLSCAPILKRLNAKQNAGARLKIQQVLYAAEFGQHAPYLDPVE